MLDLGFLPDVEKLLALTPAAPPDDAVLGDHAGRRRRAGPPLHDPADAHPGDGRPGRGRRTRVKAIEQFVYRAHALDKVEMLARILQADGRGLTMVFSRTKRTAAKVADELAERGFAAAAIHGDLGQGAREQALRAFRNGKVDVLVATDVAARGIDVEDVTHVINYQCPEDEKTYLHRIGRTGRAGQHRHRGDLRRLGRHAALGADQQGARPRHPGPGGDLLLLRRTSTPSWTSPTGTKGRLPKAEQTRAGLRAEEVEDLGETGKASGRRGAARARAPAGTAAERSARRTARPPSRCIAPSRSAGRVGPRGGRAHADRRAQERDRPASAAGRRRGLRLPRARRRLRAPRASAAAHAAVAAVAVAAAPRATSAPESPHRRDAPEGAARHRAAAAPSAVVRHLRTATQGLPAAAAVSGARGARRRPHGRPRRPWSFEVERIERPTAGASANRTVFGIGGESTGRL